MKIFPFIYFLLLLQYIVCIRGARPDLVEINISEDLNAHAS